jgi:hypothetical protein
MRLSAAASVVVRVGSRAANTSSKSGRSSSGPSYAGILTHTLSVCRDSGPSACPYSPKCLEGVVSEGPSCLTISATGKR